MSFWSPIGTSTSEKEEEQSSDEETIIDDGPIINDIPVVKDNVIIGGNDRYANSGNGGYEGYRDFGGYVGCGNSASFVYARKFMGPNGEDPPKKSFHEILQEAAYYLAEKDGFQKNTEEYWFRAEHCIDLYIAKCKCF